MTNRINTLGYLQSGIETILSRRGFDDKGHSFTGGLSPEYPLRPTQKEAFEAYRDFLRDDTPPEHKQSGYFEIPTGVGKTGVFVGLVNEALKNARAEGQKLHSVIVVPTTTLLHQTRKDILKFAPELVDHVGLYGDGHKSLHKPVTVMTYDAWASLTEQGKLNHTNVDLLVFDEAHRATSERRADNLLEAYGNGTVHLAFTATAHFDEEKSVEKTHKNQIFYKSLPNAVKGGELANYIHSQLFVIRVKPLELTDEFNDATINRLLRSDLRTCS